MEVVGQRYPEIIKSVKKIRMRIRSANPEKVVSKDFLHKTVEKQ